jgi:hypothetical protein
MSESSIVRTCPPPYHLVEGFSHPAHIVVTCPTSCRLIDSLEPSSTQSSSLARSSTALSHPALTVLTCPPPCHLVDSLEPYRTHRPHLPSTMSSRRQPCAIQHPSSSLAFHHVISSTALSHPAHIVFTCPPPYHLVDSLEPSSTHRPHLPSTMSSCRQP